ncbi:hypothetical protein A2U01_0026254 [Trifolium medium]|uniref:Uncharacterized protein n=1 Tax=Trifolium medium TaxID=97028 RepID=A0A392P0G6_9FABA|nr:hypothetical protein [Trifolium medium]
MCGKRYLSVGAKGQWVGWGFGASGNCSDRWVEGMVSCSDSEKWGRHWWQWGTGE